MSRRFEDLKLFGFGVSNLMRANRSTGFGVRFNRAGGVDTKPSEFIRRTSSLHERSCLELLFACLIRSAILFDESFSRCFDFEFDFVSDSLQFELRLNFELYFTLKFCVVLVLECELDFELDFERALELEFGWCDELVKPGARCAVVPLDLFFASL